MSIITIHVEQIFLLPNLIFGYSLVILDNYLVTTFLFVEYLP